MNGMTLPRLNTAGPQMDIPRLMSTAGYLKELKRRELAGRQEQKILAQVRNLYPQIDWQGGPNQPVLQQLGGVSPQVAGQVQDRMMQMVGLRAQAVSKALQANSTEEAQEIMRTILPWDKNPANIEIKGPDVSIDLPDGETLKGPGDVLADYFDAAGQDPELLDHEESLAYLARNGVSITRKQPGYQIVEGEKGVYRVGKEPGGTVEKVPGITPRTPPSYRTTEEVMNLRREAAERAEQGQVRQVADDYIDRIISSFRSESQARRNPEEVWDKWLLIRPEVDREYGEEYSGEIERRLKAQFGPLGGRKAAGGQEDYVIGRTYTDAQGRKAEYLGQGKWRLQD